MSENMKLLLELDRAKRQNLQDQVIIEHNKAMQEVEARHDTLREEAMIKYMTDMSRDTINEIGKLAIRLGGTERQHAETLRASMDAARAVRIRQIDMLEAKQEETRKRLKTQQEVMSKIMFDDIKKIDRFKEATKPAEDSARKQLLAEDMYNKVKDIIRDGRYLKEGVIDNLNIPGKLVGMIMERNKYAELVLIVANDDKLKELCEEGIKLLKSTGRQTSRESRASKSTIKARIHRTSSSTKDNYNQEYSRAGGVDFQ